MMFLSLRALALLSLVVSPATSFGGFDPALIHHSVVTTAAAAQHSHHLAPIDAVVGAAQNALEAYKHSLQTNPLPTKMMTGATLAMAGDAIAQSKVKDEPYDVQRAASFGTFDMAYRALQHASFPWIVEHCRGQLFTAAIGAAFMGAGTAGGFHASPDMTNNFAALEQTLASQLGIVPFLYYPVFFGLTGFMQGLTVEGSVDRAKEMFLPLMQRNLMFWIPVQFIQFGFIEESLQIPFLSVCGLGWTFILSIMAGSTKTYQEAAEENDAEDLVVAAVNTAEVMAAVSQARPEDFVMEPLLLEEEASAAGRVQNDGLVYEKI